MEAGNAGKAYVFSRLSGNIQNAFLPEQLLTRTGGAAGDAYGCAVDINSNTLIVGAQHVMVNGARAGAAYVYTRASSAQHFVLQQQLLSRTRSPFERFGRRVAVDGDTALVAAHQRFQSALYSRKEVQTITTSCNAGSSLGNYFYITWQDQHTAVQKALDRRAGGSKDLLVRGVRVHARWRGERFFYPGRIVKMNPDKTYGVQYDNGNWEFR